MKTIVLSSFLASIIASSPLVASSLTHSKPITTVGSVCLAGCVGVFTHAMHHRVKHKTEVEKLYAEHHKKIQKRTPFESKIREKIDAYGEPKKIPQDIIGTIDSMNYLHEDREELKKLIETYNSNVEEHEKDNTEQNSLYLGATITNIHGFFERTAQPGPEIRRYQNAGQRALWSLYVATATLIGMAIAYIWERKTVWNLNYYLHF